MASVATHYETVLTPVYLWMAGGIEHALVQGAAGHAQVACAACVNRWHEP